MCFGGVVALLPGDAPSRAALTLVPEPHASLLGLLDDLQEGTRCQGRQGFQSALRTSSSFPDDPDRCVSQLFTHVCGFQEAASYLWPASSGPTHTHLWRTERDQSAPKAGGQTPSRAVKVGPPWDAWSPQVALTSSTQQEANDTVTIRAPTALLVCLLSLCPDVDGICSRDQDSGQKRAVTPSGKHKSEKCTLEPPSRFFCGLGGGQTNAAKLSQLKTLF